MSTTRLTGNKQVRTVGDEPHRRHVLPPERDKLAKTPLLLWSGLCFVGLALNNAMLVVDLTLIPDVDLSTWRILPAAVGVAFLFYGLVWESE